jgi:hypothetical protein
MFVTGARLLRKLLISWQDLSEAPAVLNVGGLQLCILRFALRARLQMRRALFQETLLPASADERANSPVTSTSGCAKMTTVEQRTVVRYVAVPA